MIISIHLARAVVFADELPQAERDIEATFDIFKPCLETARGRFSLWGTRGSTPTPGARFLRHGGNTSCLSVTYGEEKFIFDAGSGIRDLGQSIMAQTSRKLHLFIT